MATWVVRTFRHPPIARSCSQAWRRTTMRWHSPVTRESSRAPRGAKDVGDPCATSNRRRSARRVGAGWHPSIAFSCRRSSGVRAASDVPSILGGPGVDWTTRELDAVCHPWGAFSGSRPLRRVGAPRSRCGGSVSVGTRASRGGPAGGCLFVLSLFLDSVQDSCSSLLAHQLLGPLYPFELTRLE